MNDQARLLREWVRRESAGPAAGGGHARLIVVAAGKGGVGTTTLAVNLALALARCGRNSLLVDGNPHRADATTLCGLDPQWGVSHVVAGWRNVSETLQVGPGGLRVLPGVWDQEYADQWTEPAQSRLIDELRAQEQADYVVVDGGAGLGAILGRFWRAADLVLMVATPDSLSIMDAYAAIKVHAEGSRVPVRTLVNQAADTQQAADVHARLARVCHRFLGLSVLDGGFVPIIPRESLQTTTDSLFSLHAPESTAARYLDRLAQSLPSMMATTAKTLTAPRPLAALA